MSADQQDTIIQCPSCGQKMRVPSGGQSKVYKCVKCGVPVSPKYHTPPPGQRETPIVEQKAAPSTMAEIFVEMGLVSQNEIDVALRKQLPTEKLFETLLRFEMITKEEMYTLFSKEPGSAAINLAHFRIDRDLTELVPLDVVRKHWVLPISSLGKSLTVAMVCPVDKEGLAAVENITDGMRIKSMLCKMDDFTNAVRKHYDVPDSKGIPSAISGLQDSTNPALSSAVYPGDATIRKALTDLVRLPIPARVMNQLDAVVGAESGALRQVVCVVGDSPALTANILCTANSAAYGLLKSVDSIPMAISLIGEESVSLLAANAQKLPAANEKLWTPLTHFSRHCARIAFTLATECGHVTPNVAYCAGLLHAIGSYAMGATDPEEYQKIDPTLIGEKRIFMEKQVFGMGYDEAGALICERWNLPEMFQAALRYSLFPEEAGDFRHIAAIVHVATCLADVEGELNLEGIAKCEDVLKLLNLDPSRIADSLGNAAQGTANASN